MNKEYILKNLGYVPLIIGDGGHGQDTKGNETPVIPNLNRRIKEHEFNQPTSRKFLKLCSDYGFDTLDVSPEDTDTPLETRVKRANNGLKTQQKKYPSVDRSKTELAIYFSFHFNAFNGKFDNKSGGISVFASSKGGHKERLANILLKELIKGTSQRNRGVKFEMFYVLRNTVMTAVLSENGFMDKLSEANLMLNEAFQDEVAKEHFHALLKFYDLPIPEETNAKVKSIVEQIQIMINGLAELEEENKELKEDLEIYKKDSELLSKIFKILGGRTK